MSREKRVIKKKHEYNSKLKRLRGTKGVYLLILAIIKPLVFRLE